MKLPSTANSSCTGLRSAILASFSQNAEEVARSLSRFDQRLWRRELKWLDVSGLALYLFDHLRELGQVRLLPPAIRERLRWNASDNRARTAALLAEAVEITRGFERAGVSCANLKGVTLSPESVPDPSLRLQLDLDFAVLEADADEARSVLEERGYALDCKSGRTWEFKAGSSELPSLQDLYKVKPQRSVELHLMPANGLLERVVRRQFAGVELPALSPVDLYLTQAEHLFKHLCSASTRAAWALETRRHIAARAGDEAFWRSVGERLEGEPRLATAVSVVALLVAEIFGDSLPESLTGLIKQEISPGVRLWVQRYGRRVLLSGPDGTKHFLLLLAALPDSSALSDRAARKPGDLRRMLIPSVLPPMITRGFAGETVGSRARRYRIQLDFVLRRLLFHCVEGARYLVEYSRFRRLLAGVGD
jgi:hypothetical protein